MTKPKIPKNEINRLESLQTYSIIDSENEKEYDILTKLACDIFKTPISLVSFTDIDRQWFKSKIGVNINETPRDISFCGHAINDPKNVTIINDARLDPRFFDNPFVLNDPNIVFYAGAPLISSEGYPLGTLCVLDYKKHDFTPIQANQLKALASQVINLLELRKKNNELKESNLEKAILIKEIHHRVKNNLQVISSLLNLQINQNIAPEAIEALKTSRDRILAMSVIHQQLYQGNSMGKINFKAYLFDLLKSIKGLYSQINTTIKGKEVELSLNVSVPLSLITSEVITNAFKHAFKQSENNSVYINIVHLGEDLVRLTIKDNGNGFDINKKWINSKSLGFEIIKILIDQIKGKVNCSSDESGTEFIIDFPSH